MSHRTPKRARRTETEEKEKDARVDRTELMYALMTDRGYLSLDEFMARLLAAKIIGYHTPPHIRLAIKTGRIPSILYRTRRFVLASTLQVLVAQEAEARRRFERLHAAAAHSPAQAASAPRPDSTPCPECGRYEVQARADHAAAVSAGVSGRLGGDLRCRGCGYYVSGATDQLGRDASAPAVSQSSSTPPEPASR